MENFIAKGPLRVGHSSVVQYITNMSITISLYYKYTMLLIE